MTICQEIGRQDVHRQVYRLPFHVPYRSPLQADYVAKAIAAGDIRPDNYYARRAANWLTRHFAAEKAILTHSCTGALELAALSLRLQPGDEVIVPSFTFTSTAAAFERAGATIVFCDIDPKTLMMDPADLVRRITARSRVIVPVHYGGVSADMDAIMRIAREHGCHVVEDAAQAFGASQDGRPIGTHGAFAAFSFHETKVVSCGQGGALIVNTRDPEIRARLDMLLDRGTDFARVRSGEKAFYNWTGTSSVFSLGGLEAAMLAAEFETLGENLGKRRAVGEALVSELGEIEGIALPAIPANAVTNHHFVAVMMQTPAEADRLLAHLKARGIDARQHYEPLHLSARAREMAYGLSSLPGAEHAWRRLVRLPVHVGMSRGDALICAGAVRAFARGVDQ